MPLLVSPLVIAPGVTHWTQILAIESHITNIVESIDNNKFTVAVYLDFEKAFDVRDIDHSY